MMKKTCFLFLLLLCGVVAIAQDFEIVSVESLPADMSAREDMKTDHNDRQCALLRVATQNIAPNQRESFSFVPDLGSEVVERATRDGEIWLWVSPGLKYLRIKHREWGQYELRLLDYVSRVEPLHTYKVTIKGTLVVALQEQNNNSPTQQYLVFQINPKEAVLEVDDQLWQVSAEGTACKFVNFGTYSYRVQAPNYYPETGIITVDDPKIKKTITVNLTPNFGWVEVKGPETQGATVYIDNAYIGKAPCKSDALKSGEHEVKIVKEMYEPYSEQIVVSDNVTTILNPSLIADFSRITLVVDADAEIWVNEEKKGIHTWTGNLASGAYRIECRLANHESTETIKNITNTMNGQTITLPAPKPIYGSINVESTPDFANIYIDGKAIGETPYFMPEILIGVHELRITKNGYVDYSETIIINRDERKQMQVKMVKIDNSLKAVASSENEIVPEGAINGLFSVSGTKKVYFSKGNLQYQVISNSWRFAEHQWDCIGNDNSNISTVYNGWIDLFGWGTGDNPIIVSETDDDYVSFVDWGINAIDNGGNKKDLWRTLNVKEWQYIFKQRYTMSGIRYAKAVVNGVKGIIILPDSWNASFYPLNETNKDEALFESNMIDVSAWYKLESAGAVFLPTAGSRSGISIYDLYSWGKYWSASRSNRNSSNYIYFGNRDFYLSEGSYLHYGRSVRLVQDHQQ